MFNSTDLKPLFPPPKESALGAKAFLEAEPKAASTNFSKSSDCPGTVLRYFPSVIFHTESS